MSNYNPEPPRVWSRVENPCTFIIPGSNYTSAFIPLTGQTVSQAQADYEMKQIYKGNVLQYKGNSARLTKKEKYSQLARCAGPNRTKVFATQTQTYTNPNTTGLLRTGFETYPFPNQIVGAPNNISGPFAYGIPNPNDCSFNIIFDGGILVCGTYANPCSGEIIRQGRTNATICNPASASNVPGPGFLCWNNKVQTFFPRQRYTMNNSGTKWPQGYKGFVSAVKPYPPVLKFDNVIDNNVFLSWTYENNNCIPISSFHLYQIVNDVTNLIKIIPFPISSTEVSNLINCNEYTFYITALSNNVESDKSNEVTPSLLTNTTLPIPILTTIPNVCGAEQITLLWSIPYICNGFYFKIYQDGSLIANTNNLNFTVTNLNPITSYSFYVTSNFNTIESLPSNIISATTLNVVDVTGTTPTFSGGIYTITYSTIGQMGTSGTIKFNSCRVQNLNVILVGAGAGGCGGSRNFNDDKGGGGGGGGETQIFNTNSFSPGIIYSVNTGNGGTGGGSASGGQTPSPIPSSGSSTTLQLNYLYSSQGGFVTAGGPTGSGAAGGNGGGSYSNGGSGGTANPSNPGSAGSSVQMISVVSGFSYGGGGGGSGAAYDSPTQSNGGGGGGVAYDFNTGTLQNPINNFGYGGTTSVGGAGGSYGGGAGSTVGGSNGGNGSYGGGGGGGYGTQTTGGFGTNGGNGGSGFCIITFNYP